MSSDGLYRKIIEAQMRRIIAAGGDNGGFAKKKRCRRTRGKGMSELDNYRLDPYRGRGDNMGGMPIGGLRIGGRKKKGGIGVGGKKRKMMNPWMKHLMAFRKKHPRMTLGEAMIAAKKSYKG